MYTHELKVGELYILTLQDFMILNEREKYMLFLGKEYMSGFIPTYKFLYGKNIVKYQWYSEEELFLQKVE